MGKALSELVAQGLSNKMPVKHVVACLEAPEKYQFLDLVRNSGADVIITPEHSTLEKMISVADIVQLEWWNHPATIVNLCRMAPQSMRLLVWCHVSGLYNPIIPQKLIESANAFLFTSPCSYEAKEVSTLNAHRKERLAVVSSGGGFSGFPEPRLDPKNPLSVGYLGTLNFAKLHPKYVDFLSTVSLPEFTVRLIGDLVNREILEQQCQNLNRVGMLEFIGYTTNVARELGSINVLAYLLNPFHYGTAENALLEAMAMGIVPVVLNNPAERNIVEHSRTGLVVDTPTEFADAIQWLAHNPDERVRLGEQAASVVRSRFTVDRLGASFHAHYQKIMSDTKQTISFADTFGASPEEWFLSCQGDPTIFRSDGSVRLDKRSLSTFSLLEKTKGSVFHFQQHFPHSKMLASWATHIENAR